MTREEAIKKLTQLKNKFLDEYIDYDGTTSAYDMAIGALQEPERKKGKWIGKPIAGYSKVRCSVCNDVFLDNAGRWKYCPNCGARMENEK